MGKGFGSAGAQFALYLGFWSFIVRRPWFLCNTRKMTLGPRLPQEQTPREGVCVTALCLPRGWGWRWEENAC